VHRLLHLIAGLLVAGLLIVPVSGAEDHPIPDEYVYCTVCHGTLFKGNVATRAPKLTGLSAWYMESQLQAFRDGLRGRHTEDLPGLEMRPMAEMLSEIQVSRISQLIADLPSREQKKRNVATTQRGQQLYATCTACHGADGRGNQQLKAPNLVVQDSWYLITQLSNYRNNIRGTEDNDTTGMQMRNASSTLLSDQDVATVVAYIKSL